jgi:alpha-beta hydrolase superfamily lysophospholipase
MEKRMETMKKFPVVFLLIGFLLGGCDNHLFVSSTATPLPTETPTPEPILPFDIEEVHFTTEDDLTLEGYLYLGEERNTGIVFAHMAGPNDQENWMPFAETLAGKGYSSLTFNFRCYGASDCASSTEPSYVILQRDINRAVDFMYEQGFENVICIGASMGGRACSEAAFDKELAGVVFVSGVGSQDPAKQDPNDMLNPDIPKLFIVSESDPTMNGEMLKTFMAFYEAAPEPKELQTFTGTVHGTELFDTRKRDEFSEMLISFVEDVIP